MPIYMDLHIAPGVTAVEVAEAHKMDVFIQGRHSCKCMTYWIDEKRGNVFCLIEAPDKEAVINLHSDSHGLIPSKIIEVSDVLVESFLGRISDPEKAAISPEGLKVFSDPSFRTILVAKINDPILLEFEFGRDKAQLIQKQFNNLVRKELLAHEGNETEQEGPGFIASFVSAAKAASCAFAIQKEMKAAGLDISGFRIALYGGEPIAKNEKLFGDTILLADRICSITKRSQVAVSSVIRELVSKDYPMEEGDQTRVLSGPDEILLSQLFTALEENLENSDFDVTHYCQELAMSKSQLYRKTLALSGFSPNIFLKEYRLEKAKQLLKKRNSNITQIAFDTGFTSPSYFTKCFKKKYGLLPMSYQDMLH